MAKSTSRPSISAATSRAATPSRWLKSMIYVTNEDKPGFIGHFAGLLGDGKINIATFHLGRNKQGGDAIALVEVEDLRHQRRQTRVHRPLRRPAWRWQNQHRDLPSRPQQAGRRRHRAG